MICLKLPVSVNPAQVTCLDVPVWERGQPCSRFKNCPVSEGLGCRYMNTGAIAEKLLSLVSVILSLACGIALASEGGRTPDSAASPSLPSLQAEQE